MTLPLFGRNPRSPSAPLKNTRGKGTNAFLRKPFRQGYTLLRSQPRKQANTLSTAAERRRRQSTAGERVERVFLNCRSWAACRSCQPARPIQLIARNLLPSSRSEAVSSRRIHHGLSPEIRRPLSGTRPSWTFATPLQTQLQTMNAKSLGIVPDPPALWAGMLNRRW